MIHENAHINPSLCSLSLFLYVYVCAQMVRMVHGLEGVYGHLMGRLGSGGPFASFAIRDDYAFWARHHERYTQ